MNKKLLNNLNPNTAVGEGISLGLQNIGAEEVSAMSKTSWAFYRREKDGWIDGFGEG